MPRKERDNRPGLLAISSHLVRAGQTLAVAESVTSGDLQSQFSLAEEAMRFFQGGITVYNLSQKVHHLRIDPIHALSCNCVSAIVAEEMSKGVAALFKSDWGIGITGYASPVPEQGIDSLFAYAAFCHGNKIVSSMLMQAEEQEPLPVRQYYVHEVLKKMAAITRDHTYG